MDIKKENAIKAYENANSCTKKVLEDLFGKNTFVKDVRDRIKTVDDAVLELGEQDEEVIEYRKLIKACVSDKLLNYQLAIIVVKALNEGWTPNWQDKNEEKYYLWWRMDKFVLNGWYYYCSCSIVGARLSLKSSELAKHAGVRFEKLFKSFML